MVYLMLQALNLNWELNVGNKLGKPSDDPEPGFGCTLYWHAGHAGLEQAKDCHPVYHFSKLFNQMAIVDITILSAYGRRLRHKHLLSPKVCTPVNLLSAA